MNFAERVATLTCLIESGKTVEAMEHFYADHVTMQENNDPPRIGKVACLVNERANVAGVKSVAAELVTQAIDEKNQTVLSEWRFAFTDLRDRQFLVEEISVQRWQNDQVVRERFYYGPATIVA